MNKEKATEKKKVEKAKAKSEHGAVKVTKKCGCGCGATVKRHFLPGHDMKLKSRLLKAVNDGNAEAEKELLSRGWA